MKIQLSCEPKHSIIYDAKQMFHLLVELFLKLKSEWKVEK